MEAASGATDKERKAIAEHATKSEAEARINAMVSLAQVFCPVVPDQLDISPWLLNVANGTIDLRTGKLRPHQREDFLTKLVPFGYDPNASCLTWESFLETALAGKQDLIEFLWQAIGYSLTGDITEQCLFLLYGSGANGKSTLLQVVQSMLSDYAEQADASSFLYKDRDNVRNDLAKLRGARFVSAVEVEEGRRLAEVLVKQITGGDKLTARFLFNEYFDFQPQFKLWLAANHKPIIRGTDHAIWRRIRLVPFTVTIPQEKRDKRLLEKLRTELPGVLSWAVRGCLAWQQEGQLSTPEAVQEATRGYQSEMDTVGAFLSECCLEKPDAQVKAGDLLAAYQEWSGDKKMTHQKLRFKLEDRGFRRERSTITGHILWHGIGLLTSQPEEH
jgi:putative DNA primase/helicase